MTEKELMHFGIPGMHWGTRRGSTKPAKKSRSAKRAERLSKKYGTEVEEGIREKHVKGALNFAERQKAAMVSDIIEQHMNKTMGYYDVQGVKKMSQKQYDRITDQANTAIAAVQAMRTAKISKFDAPKGKTGYSAKLEFSKEKDKAKK